MNRLRLALFVAACTLATPALSASQRTFVSGQGVDSASCNLTQPCRQFTRALTQTLAGGEIVVLDSAGYGPVSIRQDVAVVAPPGVYAGITVFSGGGGIYIGDPATKVKLRGLVINGQVGDTGIQINMPGSVEIIDCEVTGMAYSGLETLQTP